MAESCRCQLIIHHLQRHPKAAELKLKNKSAKKSWRGCRFRQLSFDRLLAATADNGERKCNIC
jgi:hypothetical protein